MYSQLDPKITDEARNLGFKVKENCGVWKNMFIAPPHPSINNYKVLNVFIAGCKR